MYVRKFEADTIEEALKDIKRELGPDAVILKTLTNKGLKGAFKKKKIEITAAISEKNYVRKAQVDSVMTDSQRDEFYSGSAGYISNMIDKHEQSKEKFVIPTPDKGEVEADYISRCMKAIGSEYDTQEIALAVCYAQLK
jgi:flagellar biosynthesis GTPase FlhF